MTTHKLSSFILSSFVAGCLIAPATLCGQTNQTIRAGAVLNIAGCSRLAVPGRFA